MSTIKTSTMLRIASVPANSSDYIHGVLRKDSDHNAKM